MLGVSTKIHGKLITASPDVLTTDSKSKSSFDKSNNYVDSKLPGRIQQRRTLEIPVLFDTVLINS